MALEIEAIGLIASSCVLLFLLVLIAVIFAYVCYRRLENKKLSRLPKYGAQDVSAWPFHAHSFPATCVQEDIGVHSNAHVYRPRILTLRADIERKFSQSRSVHDGDTHVFEDGSAISRINVPDYSLLIEKQDYTHDTTVERGRIATRSSDSASYGHTDPTTEHVIHNTDGKIIHGFVIEDFLDNVPDTKVTQQQKGQIEHHKSIQHHVHHQGLDSPQVDLKSEVIIKQMVSVGEGGQLVVTGGVREVNLTGSTGFMVSQAPVSHDHNTYNITSSPVHSSTVTGHSSRTEVSEQVPTSTAFALEGNAASGGRVSVPRIVVNEWKDVTKDGSENDDVDDDEYDRKRRENYKVIKKHSAYKIPDWVIKTVTEQHPDLDPETKDTVTQLEQRLITNQEHRESVSEIEKRLNNLSSTSTTPSVSNNPTRRSAVTHILDLNSSSDEEQEHGAGHQAHTSSQGRHSSITDTLSEQVTSPDHTNSPTRRSTVKFGAVTHIHDLDSSDDEDQEHGAGHQAHTSNQGRHSSITDPLSEQVASPDHHASEDQGSHDTSDAMTTRVVTKTTSVHISQTVGDDALLPPEEDGKFSSSSFIGISEQIQRFSNSIQSVHL